MSCIPIEHLDDPRVQVYRQVKSAPVMRRGDFFIVEGSKTVQRLLESRYETASVLLTQKRASEWLPRIPEQVPCYVLPDAVASMLVGFNFHVGVMACGRRQPSPTLEAVFADVSQPATIVLCPKCDNPENLGAIIRIAAGFGVDAILLGPSCSDPYMRRVIRVSMGAALSMTLLESRNLARDLARLRSEFQFELVGTVLNDQAVPLSQATRARRLGLLLGNEDTGLDDETLSLCDQQVTIPMHPGTDSLNVAIAAGIFLHHFTQTLPLPA
ncbi:RNA methyltransferase [bacterium]|nr:RNA methyltransferase [bacterium]